MSLEFRENVHRRNIISHWDIDGISTRDHQKSEHKEKE